MHQKFRVGRPRASDAPLFGTEAPAAVTESAPPKKVDGRKGPRTAAQLAQFAAIQARRRELIAQAREQRQAALASPPQEPDMGADRGPPVSSSPAPQPASGGPLAAISGTLDAQRLYEDHMKLWKYLYDKASLKAERLKRKLGGGKRARSRSRSPEPEAVSSSSDDSDSEDDRRERRTSRHRGREKKRPRQDAELPRGGGRMFRSDAELNDFVRQRVKEALQRAAGGARVAPPADTHYQFQPPHPGTGPIERPSLANHFGQPNPPPPPQPQPGPPRQPPSLDQFARSA